MRLPLAVAGCLLSAVLYAGSFPPVGFRGLAWVSLVPYLLVLRRVGPARAVWLTILTVEAGALLAARALPAAVSDYFLQPWWVSWSFALAVWLVMGAIYYVPFAWAVPHLTRRYRRAWPLLVAAAWTAVELARARLLTGTDVLIGNPWVLAGYSQVGWDALVQIASVTGVYGVGFAVVAVNAGLAQAIGSARPGTWRAAAGALVLGAAPLVGALLFGHAELRAAEGAPEEPAVRVAVVQGDLDVGSRWSSELHGRNLEEYLALTLQAIDRVRPALVVWPEAALTFHLADEAIFRRHVARVLEQGPAELVAGGPRAGSGEPPAHYNSVFLLSPEGEIRAHYDKQVLLPFTEFQPLAQLDLVRRDFGEVRRFARGEPTPPLPTRPGPAGVLVCNEAMLPELAAERVRQGAAFLVNPSNDSWIASRGFAEMMFDLVSLRAVEQRRYLVRASTSGPSAIVDPWGRAPFRTEPLSRAIAVGEVHPRHGLSLYARLGDSFALGCGGVVILALVAPRRGRAQTASQ